MVDCINAAFLDYRPHGPPELNAIRYYLFEVRDEKPLVRVRLFINKKLVKAERGTSYADGGAEYAIDPRTMKIVERWL